MNQVQTDVENFQSYRGDTYSIASVIGALLLKLLQSNGVISNPTVTQAYDLSNFSGSITAVNTPQDLASANPNRDRLTIQNLDSTDVLLVAIGEDAVAGRSYEIEPRGLGILEEGEADKRISVMSAKTGLKFVAIARVKN